MKVTTKTDIKEFPLLNRGKVRDIYDIDDSTLLIVTTDRMSAFDVIMNEPVPYKGVILNQITLFWMKKFAHLVKNHLIESDVDKFPAALAPYREELEGRSVLVKKAKPLPVECIVRGYITGSGWKDYKATGSVCGYKLPEGLLESARLEQPLFTPSTKRNSASTTRTFPRPGPRKSSARTSPIRSRTSPWPSSRKAARELKAAASSLPTPSSSSAWSTAS
mgnify:FL=1